jgi:hypothetical protein
LAEFVNREDAMKTNYQLILDKEIAALQSSGAVPTLLLQSCCGPCSSYVLEYLTRYFSVTLYYYNPNIYPPAEYEKRLSEQRRTIREMDFPNPVKILESDYDPAVFYDAVKGLESEPEGGARCTACFVLRLENTAKKAAELGFQYFATTLTVSPHKNAELLNTIGGGLGEKYGVKYLYSDFKKREGYKRSIELSREHGLYRQVYCGCKFSMEAGE